MQPDGKLVIAGVMNDSNFIVARFQSNGSPDLNFGLGGIDTTSFGGGTLLKSAASQKDGKIVCVGLPAFSLARFKGDPTTVSILKNISTLEENSGTTPIVLKVVLNQVSAQTIKINYNTKDGTAKAG
jgi:Domain of unknown function (DUF5122) beta-propeller